MMELLMEEAKNGGNEPSAGDIAKELDNIKNGKKSKKH